MEFTRITKGTIKLLAKSKDSCGIMESWNVIRSYCKDADFVLLNKSQTLIQFSQRIKVDIISIMSEMEEANVPFSYTEGIERIYFTLLRCSIHGDYKNGKIRLSCGHASRDMHACILVHELAHHIDEEEYISGCDAIISEKKKKSHLMTDIYARKDTSEYVAVGFEVYYFGSNDERTRMRKNNPKLWNAIKRIHNKHRIR